ncbi:MAG: thioredoxin family protein [Chryseobacterium sp.]|nr:thioredoxin family protein [Chryseobacterium sp.]
MKQIFWFLTVLVCVSGYAQKPVTAVKKEFTSEALNQKMMTLDGEKITIAEVLKSHEGKVLIIDFWASWCRDCILALPKTEEIKNRFPEVEFVYFSLDRTFDQWKKGLDKYEIAGQKNYWFDEGWKNNFNNYVELNWVPRFMVINQQGKIADYYAISPEDPELLETLRRLTTK